MGLRFPNRVGLAAGFDKNAQCVDGLWWLGFGFLEMGTVTPRPQPGRPSPRLFRVAGGALVNSMGFPNAGAQAVAAQLARCRRRGIVGINIGKNADTPLDRAVDDYVACLRVLQGVADYIAINISSPNTQSLRELHEPQRLRPLLEALLETRESQRSVVGRAPPLLLKISPDLDEDTFGSVVEVLRHLPLEGAIATNTTVKHEFRQSPEGGLSGAPLHARACQVIARLRQALGGRALIGVGGIDSLQRAQAMRAAGADLVQLYTGLIYEGPGLVRSCVRGLQTGAISG